MSVVGRTEGWEPKPCKSKKHPPLRAGQTTCALISQVKTRGELARKQTYRLICVEEKDPNHASIPTYAGGQSPRTTGLLCPSDNTCSGS